MCHHESLTIQLFIEFPPKINQFQITEYLKSVDFRASQINRYHVVFDAQ